MTFAYNSISLYNLAVTKEARRWHKQDLITADQLGIIQNEYACEFYHPNFVVRILLFVASLLGLAAVTGMGALVIVDSSSEFILSIWSLIYGVASFFALDRFFIGQHHHYKTGLTEALLYHSCLFTILGLAGTSDFNTGFVLFCCIIALSFAAWRYLDVVCTLGAVISLVAFVFYQFYSAGGILQQVIPFAIIALFTPLYFIVKNFRRNPNYKYWNNNLVIVEGASLLFIYSAGNYFVVRELSESMMNLYLEPGQDIPFAYLFYALTVIIPATYLYFGIRNKDIVLLRVSLIAIAFSVFTFKYYFSLGHPAITLTIAGGMLTGVSLWLMQYLKVIRHGFTRENHLPEKWADMNVQAIIISQTMGGNQVVEDQTTSGGGGGEFGGGGASDRF